MIYPAYTIAVVLGLWPAAGVESYSFSTAPGGGLTLDDWSVTAEGVPVAPPTPEQITAAAPPLLRPLCVARLREARRAAIDARRAETWPGLSAGEVSEAIAAGEPSAAIVADYLADRGAIHSAYQAQAAAAGSLSADAAWACAQTGVLP